MMRPENWKAERKTQPKNVMANREQQIKDAARVGRTNQRLKAYAERMGVIRPETVKEGN